MFVWFIVDGELKVILSDFFTSNFLTSNCFQYLKEETFLTNNFTMTPPHEIKPERWLVYKHSTGVLFCQVALFKNFSNKWKYYNKSQGIGCMT